MLTHFSPTLTFLVLGCSGLTPHGHSDELLDEYTPKRVDWATLAEFVTIRHFRAEDFPVGQDSSAIWALGEDVICEVEGDLIDGESPTDSGVIVTVQTPANWPAQVKPMKAFTHGYTDSVSPDNESNYPFFVNAWAKSYGTEYDVLLVDWQPLAIGEWHFPSAAYNDAAKNAVDVGRYLGLCLASLANSEKLDNRIHLVGHSLGAHLMGKAGRVFDGQHGTQMTRITGLDPAGPRWWDGFWLAGNNAIPELHNNTISIDSAAFVDIIHSNGDLTPSAVSFWPALGAAFQLGHMDFYPDGGEWQLGCNDKLSGTPGCSHSRAVQYYYWSIGNPDYFPSQACGSVEECQDEQFSGDTIAWMGEESYLSYAGGRQLLYHDITDSCWRYTAPPTNTENC